MSSRAPVHEEDVDDLDDVVDQFNAEPTTPTAQSTPSGPNHTKTPIPSTSSTENSVPVASSSVQDADASLPDDLAKQLAEGMESLMRELSEGQHVPTSEEEKKRQEAWEKMLIDGMNGLGGDDPLDRNLGDNNSKATGGASQTAAGDAFQASILQAMGKLKDSDSNLHTDASAAASATDDPLEAILKQLGEGMDESGEDNGELQDMLETMMQQLMSKEVLYEPLKELSDKFPNYLSENDSKLSADEKSRFRNQLSRVSEIVRIFEDPSYKDDDAEKSSRVVTLMNEMQSFGSPPTEIMGPLPSGIDFGSNGTPNLPEGCSIM